MNCTIHLNHEVCVDNDAQYQVSPEELNRELDEVISLFSSQFPWDEKYIKFATVDFLPGVGDCVSLGAPCKGKLNGYATRTFVGIYTSSTTQPLSTTTFKHEVGHVLLLRSGKVEVNQQDVWMGKTWGF